MSNFEVKVVPFKLENHPNADLLDVAVVGDYRSIVAKGIHETNSLCVYIPEQAVLPEWLIEKMNLTGRLAGSQKNRVKAVRLRGVVSQGLCYPVELSVPSKGITNAIEVMGDDGKLHHHVVYEDQDVAELLGITKYEPPIPVHMAGKAAGASLDLTVNYDFENIKKYPDMFEDGEEVIITEKIHGTFALIGIAPPHLVPEKLEKKLYKGVGLVSSKGLAKKGILLDCTDTDNLYVKTAIEQGILDALIDRYAIALSNFSKPLFLLGEIYGKGVQDLSYGMENGVGFRVFDACTGGQGSSRYYDHVLLNHLLNDLGIQRVPVLYHGPYSKEIVKEYTDGLTTVDGKNFNIREGIVITSAHNADHPKHGRKIAKSVSDDYLFRKGGTEYN